MTPTEKYINENKYVYGLERRKLPGTVPRRVVGWSVSKLMKYHVKMTLSAMKRYPIEVYRGRHHLGKTWRLKNTFIQKRALVIGNGPSQGQLTVKHLEAFREEGGQTFCVNYWPENSRLAAHTPNWMVFSDPATFTAETTSSQNLYAYLSRNSSIKIAAPVSFLHEFKRLKLQNEVYTFIDTELSLWSSISPLLPRGYLSMTLYKALAWSLHMGFKKIGVIGMDNTYPRNTYNDQNNRVCNLETHAGADDYLSDQSSFYLNVAALLDDLTRLFLHLDYFPQDSVVNLDPYSLTDRFRKVNLDEFFHRNNFCD